MGVSVACRYAGSSSLAIVIVIPLHLVRWKCPPPESCCAPPGERARAACAPGAACLRSALLLGR
eukprot:scaffold106429_cov64-Phaeocystis_antarctica.AAC.6